MRLPACAATLAVFAVIGPSAGLAQTASPAEDRTTAQEETATQSLRPRQKPWPDRTKVWPRHWYKDWVWWVGEGVIAGLQAADAHSTIAARSSCPTCSESNLFLGKHPSNGAIIGVSGLGFGVATGLHVLGWKACPDLNRRSHAWRIACNATVPAIGAGIKIPGIIHNYNLASPSTPTSPNGVGMMQLGSLVPVSYANGQTLR